MTTELSSFAARVREFIAALIPVAADVRRLHLTSASENEPPHVGCYIEEFNALALELFALQFTHNAAYRPICNARRISPDNVDYWTQIPAVPAAAFKELDLTCLPPVERSAIFRSSGTTEQRPSRHFHSAESLALYEASLLPWFRAHVAPDLKSQIPNLKLAMLVPPPSQAPHSSLVHMFETVRREFTAPESAFLGHVGSNGSWELDFDAAVRALEPGSSGTAPLVLLGTAFSFVHLLDFLAEQNLRFQLPPGSRVMETGGYKGRSRSLPKAELHSLITQRLGVPPLYIVCEYGMSELSSQAYDAPRSFHFPPWARAQIISPETGREVADGETGLIRVFDLANAFSVMAIQTEDLGVRRGDGFELIGRATLAEQRGCSLMAV